MSGESPKFAEYKALVNSQLVSFLQQCDGVDHPLAPRSLYDPVRYAMEGNGKRIRPVLLLISCEATGGSVEAALPAAVAVELMHNFTLVHDDIMDCDDTRRGRPTVHRKWDTNTAILAGDALVVLAYQSLLRTTSPRLREICRLFTAGTLEICEGQAMDRDFEQDNSVTMARYQAMILKKTARLLAICTQIGGLLGECNPRQIAALKLFAEHVGLAFQIQDDLLDITIDQAILGKDFGSDVRRHKRTFLYVHTMEQGTPEQRRALGALFSKPAIQHDDIMAAQRIFRDSGALAAADQAVRRHFEHANAQLASLAPAVSLDEFRRLVEMILHRNA